MIKLFWFRKLISVLQPCAANIDNDANSIIPTKIQGDDHGVSSPKYMGLSFVMSQVSSPALNTKESNPNPKLRGFFLDSGL